eukprot:m51a1_g12824 putative calpain-7 (87) ;mRNA; r:1130-1390
MLGSSEVKITGYTGLISLHMYAVVDIWQSSDGSLHLVKLRNPWGCGQWDSKFSKWDRDSWTPELQSKLHFDIADDQKYDNGMFWMS